MYFTATSLCSFHKCFFQNHTEMQRRKKKFHINQFSVRFYPPASDLFSAWTKGEVSLLSEYSQSCVS